MKNLFNAFLFITLSLSLNSQTNRNANSVTNDQASDNVVADVKKGFVENQGYLNSNASSFKNYVHFYADSLKGFDENTLKAQL